jgi:hypothetical protein
MTQLMWDVVGERKFKSGIDRGVLYSGETRLGVAWNGLVTVEERSDEAAAPLYQDGIKYLDSEIMGNFSATIKAFTYPDEFEQYEGLRAITTGLGVHDQPSKRFFLTYRTKMGNDVDGSDHGYQIHLLYNLTVVSADKPYTTLAEKTVPMLFNWSIFGVPEIIDGFRPTAHIILDSTEITPGRLGQIEDILYGTEDTPPRMPTIEEILEIAISYLITIIDHGDGTWSAIGPDELITMLDANTFQITEANAIYLDPDTYTITDTIS